MIERLAHVPVEVDYGSEFRYRDPIVDKTQPDHRHQPVRRNGGHAGRRTRSAPKGREGPLHLQRGRRDAHARIERHHLHARRARKSAWLPQKPSPDRSPRCCSRRFILARCAASSTPAASQELMQELTRIPHKIETILQRDAAIEDLARQFFRHTDFLYLGRGIHYPIALEGALKLKEISYIHAEGYPAGEMKHGPNALIDENLPVVIIATRDESDPASMTRYEKTISNLQEVKARDGIVIAVVTEGDQLARGTADHVIEIPAAPESDRADSRNRSAATAGLSHRRAPRMRRRSAPQPRQIRHRRIACSIRRRVI